MGAPPSMQRSFLSVCPISCESSYGSSYDGSSSVVAAMCPATDVYGFPAMGAQLRCSYGSPAMGVQL
eukprot:4437664-Prymnesium_polylepis.1